MAPIRTRFLNGEFPDECVRCRSMEQHGKPSGRQRQLLKVGVRDPWFAKTMISSPMRPAFDHSHQHQGHTNNNVQDWQIDLGNYCNGACLFCDPQSSSRLAAEYKQLGLIDQVPGNSWCDDPELLERFISDLITNSHCQYLHFIGGETLITPGFKKILQALDDNNRSSNSTIGFTTNLNAWSDSVVELLTKFQQVNLGLSIETMTPVNDYVRWPNQHEKTLELLDRWVTLAKQHNWLVQLRITPTCLTIHELDTVYEYAWNNNLSVESCNFLQNPAFMRIEVLPIEYRIQCQERLQQWIDQHQVESNNTMIINTRDPTHAQEQIVQDAKSYIRYLKESADESFRLPDLVKYLKQMESLRKNSVLNYLPEYENLFRSAGY